jgi:hypothetical protein
MLERICGLYRWTAAMLAAMTLLAAVVMPLAANARAVSPVVSFLLKPRDVRGIVPGRAQVFRTVSAVRNGAGERPAKPQVRRYEAEGFVGAAIVRIHDQAEPSARGISSVFEFETPTGAEAEMKAELKEELDLEAPRTGGFHFLTLRRFKVPGVRKAAAYAFVSNKAAARLGFETGIGKGLFIEGNCLLSIGIYRPTSKEVTKPVITGVQAISGRAASGCP